MMKNSILEHKSPQSPQSPSSLIIRMIVAIMLIICLLQLFQLHSNRPIPPSLHSPPTTYGVLAQQRPPQSVRLRPLRIQRQRKPPRQRPTPNRANRPTGNPRGKPSEENGIYCYTCTANFDQIAHLFNPSLYIYNDPCYRLALNISKADSDYLTKCAPSTRFCVVEITRTNGVLAGVTRRCGEEFCRKNCFIKGYGIIKEVCTHCCDGKPNDDNADYDQDSDGYNCPDEPH